jgi:hypothetical protein
LTYNNLTNQYVFIQYKYLIRLIFKYLIILLSFLQETILYSLYLVLILVDIIN